MLLLGYLLCWGFSVFLVACDPRHPDLGQLADSSFYWEHGSSLEGSCQVPLDSQYHFSELECPVSLQKSQEVKKIQERERNLSFVSWWETSHIAKYFKVRFDPEQNREI